jgi:hypothetical protein
MNRSKIVAILTGAIAVLLSVIYLIVVQFLDFRGEMVPAPMSDGVHTTEVAQARSVNTNPLISSPNL